MSESFPAILSRVQRLGPVSSKTLARTSCGRSWAFNCMDGLLVVSNSEAERGVGNSAASGEVTFGRKFAYITKPRLSELDTRL